MIRTQESIYKFILDGKQVVMLEGTILKIKTNEKKHNLEVIEGRISVITQNKSLKLLTINDKTADGDKLLVSRFLGDLKILNLGDFILKEYGVEPAMSKPDLIRSEFINKSDFISFTRHYFQDTKLYNRFLAAQAPLWKSEFLRQNNSQTKVLQRSIASEKEKTKREASIRAHEAAQLKKLRETFFYRTFSR
ncbi:MAG: hypothetical protein AABY53_09080 [Bdellovibrionota bacterium]